MYDVITIGSATRDVFLSSKAFRVIRSDEFSTGYGECVSLGSKIEVDEAVFTTGGGGTNTAATFASLGFKTACITRIGDDMSGEEILQDLKKRRVDTSHIKQVKRGQSGFSTLLTATGGERSVLVHRGVSNQFDIRDVKVTKLKAKWFYISSVAGNLDLVLKVARHAKAQGAQVAYNPGSLELKKGKTAFRKLLPYLDILNMNKEEAQMLSGNQTTSVKELLQSFGKYDTTFIVTDGGRGAYIAHKDDIFFAKTRNIPVTSRTGAGDAFGAGTVAGMMKGYSIQNAVAVGTLNAESVIQSFGAKYGILSSWPSKKDMQSISVRKLTL